jgi:probable lipoprotein NlpC
VDYILQKRLPICFLFFFQLCPVFAAIPFQGINLHGEAALNARLSLIYAAEKYLGTPYCYGGEDAGGVDCSGLVVVSFRDSLNLTVPRSAKGLYDWAEKISTQDLKPGDLVFFVTGTTSAVTHTGIFIGNGRFIHSASEGVKTGVIYSVLEEPYWKRTYKGAGRALPWDSQAETALAKGGFDKKPSALPIVKAPGPAKIWASSNGFFAGGGLAWTFGGIFHGAPSVYRGLAGQIKIGYKGLSSDNSFQIALELRPEKDRGLGITRLPVTLSMGSDRFQFFCGPAFTFGDPVLQTGETYHPAFSKIGELGFATAFPPIKIKQGALSVFGEIAWQPYFGEGKTKFSSDFTANTRISAGLRYLFLL